MKSVVILQSMSLWNKEIECILVNVNLLKENHIRFFFFSFQKSYTTKSGIARKCDMKLHRKLSITLQKTQLSIRGLNRDRHCLKRANDTYLFQKEKYKTKDYSRGPSEISAKTSLIILINRCGLRWSLLMTKSEGIVNTKK